MLFFEIAGRDNLPNRAFDPIDDILAILDSGAGGGTHVKSHHASVDRGEEILADDP
jgi:hypothetical protein